MKLVLIEWIDAFSISGWTPLKEVSEKPDRSKYACRTVGWLTHDGDDFKTVVSSDGHDECAGMMTIPTRCIVTMREISEPE